MKIQVLSDLHLENIHVPRDWSVTLPVSCDVLCLVGDIGDPFSKVYWSFLKYASENAKFVLLLTGNHESWGRSPSEVDAFLKEETAKTPNVIFMQRDVFMYGGYAFLGCTLWSHIPYKYHDEFAKGCTDFQNIRHSHPTTFNFWHHKDREWLEKTLKDAKHREFKTVVLTHYSPMHNVPHLKKYRNDPTQHLFSTDLRAMFGAVDLWCFGHTHSDVEGHVFKIKGFDTMFVSNQCGKLDDARHMFDKNFNMSLPEDCDKKCPVFPESDINFI